MPTAHQLKTLDGLSPFEMVNHRFDQAPDLLQLGDAERIVLERPFTEVSVEC